MQCTHPVNWPNGGMSGGRLSGGLLSVAYLQSTCIINMQRGMKKNSVKIIDFLNEWCFWATILHCESYTGPGTNWANEMNILVVLVLFAQVVPSPV